VGVQRRSGVVEHGMGERLALGVPGEEPRDPHGAVVHVHPLLVPWHGAGERVEQLVGRDDKARAQIEPGAVGQLPALHSRAEVGNAEVARGAKQRGLDDKRHAMSLARVGTHVRNPRVDEHVSDLAHARYIGWAKLGIGLYGPAI
jgi:hypothetical protein